MNKYNGIIYNYKENCFEKINHIDSKLIYGDFLAIENPWITVVVPTYKRAYLLSQALESILTQWHTDFRWDVVVVDNEPYDGNVNETEKLIRKIDNKRILYYRNSDNVRPADNFNRGVLLARGKWVTMLHDDDLLVANTLQNIGKLIKAYENLGNKTLGAISASYYQFEYDKEEDKVKADIDGVNRYLCSLPTDYNLYKVTEYNVLATSHIGGSIPSNGTTYNREAFIEIGGINEDFGISGDLIFLYCMSRKYSVYYTLVPMGFYRWGANTMIKSESTYRTIKDGFNFREYAYSRNVFSKIIGIMFRNCHYRKFTSDVINERNKVSLEKLKLKDFDEIYEKKPNKIWYFIYIHFILKIYFMIKRIQTKRLAKSSQKENSDVRYK